MGAAMTTSDQEDKARARNGDTGTFLSHTHIDDAGGRFAAVNAAKVVGQSPAVAASYPACSPALAVQLPDEPPLRFDNPSSEPSTAPPAVEVGGPVDAPSSDGGPASPSGGLVSEWAGGARRGRTAEHARQWPDAKR
jgi:hypothetical protein